MASDASPLVTIARAFAPLRHLRALVTPKAGHLAPLDGLRALAILWTLAFHTGWYSFARMPRARYLALFDDARWTPLWRGHFGVDVFFVLSGFLIAGMLFDERERSGRLRLGLFYVRRLMRLWPTLLCTIAAVAMWHGRSPMIDWPSALYVVNFVPMLSGGMSHTWSLAIEEHFYLFCPWLVDAIAPLSPPRRQLVLGSLVALSCVIAAVVVVAGDFHVVDAEIVPNRGILRWARGWDALYSKPWMRVGPLLAGVMAAVAHRDGRTMPALARSGVRGGVLFVSALALAALATEWRVFESAPRALEVAYIAAHRALFGLAVALVLLFTLSEHPMGRALGRALGARALYPVAQLAYAAYLFNPMVVMAVQRRLAPLTSAMSEGAALAVLGLAEALATFAVALVVHVLIERPFMELRPRASDEGAAAAAPSRARLVRQIAMMVLLGALLPAALTYLVPRLLPARPAGPRGRPAAISAPEAAAPREVLSLPRG